MLMLSTSIYPYLGVPRELKPDDLSMMEVNQPLLSMSYDTKFPTSAPPPPIDALATPTPTCTKTKQPAPAPIDALTSPPPTNMQQQQQQDTPTPAPMDALTTPPPTSMQQQQQETPASAPAPMDALTTPPPTCIQQPCMHHQQQQTTCSWKFYHQCAFKNDNGVLTRTSNSFVTFGVTSAQPDKYSASVSFFNRPKNDDTEYEIISTGSQVYPTNQNITESRTFTYNTNGYYELGYNVTFGDSGYCTNKTVEYLCWIFFDDDSCSFGKM